MTDSEHSGPTRVRTRVRRRKRRRSRKPLYVTLGILGTLVILGILTLVAARGVQSRLVVARAAMTEGRAALVAGDPSGAQEAFERASSELIGARGSYGNPLLLTVGYLPLIGRSIDSVGAIIDAGELAATAGTEMTAAVEQLPGGPAALAPQAGRIPLEPLEAVAPALHEAEGLLGAGIAELEAGPDSMLLPVVGDARSEFDRELTEARRVVASASAIAQALPGLLGADGPKRYFFAAQNPAEMRGTGGFIGAFAILTVDEGRMRLGGFERITSLRSLGVGDVEPPNPDYAERYNQYGGASFWQNINMTPDFPSAATAIERLYEASSGDTVDGVIASDPFGLAELVEVTGPVLVPGTSTEVDAETLVPYVTNQAYRELTNSVRRKRLLGDVAEEVFTRFLRGVSDPALMGRALVEAAAGGHLLIHSKDSETQAALARAGVTGELTTPDDLLGVIWNNAVGNKIDYYAEQEVRYSVRLGAEGTAVAEADVSLTNEAPAEGEPRYIIGPYSKEYRAGESITIFSTYCALTCELIQFRYDGVPSQVTPETELGHPVFPAVLTLPSGESQTLGYTWNVERAWRGDSNQGIYRVTVRTQPTIRPTHLRVDIQAPAGMEIVEATPGLRVSEGRAVWEGTPEPEAAFEIEFRRPALSGLWNSFLELLGKPIIEF